MRLDHTNNKQKMNQKLKIRQYTEYKNLQDLNKNNSFTNNINYLVN